MCQERAAQLCPAISESSQQVSKNFVTCAQFSMHKLRNREAQCYPKGYMGRRWGRRDANPGNLTPDSTQIMGNEPKLWVMSSWALGTNVEGPLVLSEPQRLGGDSRAGLCQANGQCQLSASCRCGQNLHMRLFMSQLHHLSL